MSGKRCVLSLIFALIVVCFNSKHTALWLACFQNRTCANLKWLVFHGVCFLVGWMLFSFRKISGGWMALYLFLCWSESSCTGKVWVKCYGLPSSLTSFGFASSNDLFCLRFAYSSGSMGWAESRAMPGAGWVKMRGLICAGREGLIKISPVGD